MTDLPGTEKLCEAMHDEYERAARREGWETQEASRTAWADVPEANKATMRASVQIPLATIESLTADNERLRAGLRAIASSKTPCEQCDKMHMMRCSNPHHEPHPYSSLDDSCGAVTWADPGDGHPYRRMQPSKAASRLLADGDDRD